MASWTTMRALGSVSGWGGGSVCRGRVDHVTRNRTCAALLGCLSSKAVRVSARGRSHEHLVRELDAANPHVQFDERGVETEHGGLLGHRQTKGPATRKATPKPPRHSSTLLNYLPPSPFRRYRLRATSGSVVAPTCPRQPLVHCGWPLVLTPAARQSWPGRPGVSVGAVLCGRSTS